MSYYILVIAPMDQVFVGPFDSRADATDHARQINHDSYVMSHDDYAANVKEFGRLPVKAK